MTSASQIRVTSLSIVFSPSEPSLYTYSLALWKCKRGCYFGRNCLVLTWEITHFTDSKYHVVGFIFTDFNVDHTVQMKYVISHDKT